ncbi:MAG TPA: sensor histidine kinase, partial [Actinomycetota bacterium]|nr:sensor histidine kinase [Actinomycetota bacterium]
LALALPVIAFLVAAFVISPHQYLKLELLFWVLILGAIELFPVPSRQGLQLSLGFPIRLALAILYPAPVAATAAFVGIFDPREWTGRRPIELALLDRAQIALAVLAGSSVFHALASVYSPASPWYVFIPAVLLATAADYAVNVTVVVLYVKSIQASTVREILAGMRLGSPPEFLVSYLGLSLIGGVIAKLYLSVELWAVVAFLFPLLFARQMFFRTIALEQATEELKDRERLLRALSNRMAEERHDERMQIAGYLHDELAQLLFRLTLQVEMAKKRLTAKDLEALGKNLEVISDTKQQASDMVRALIRDLHRSPVGRKGLAEAINSFVVDAGRDQATRLTMDLSEVTLPAAIQLLVYQIAREATLNAIKHAGARAITISLRETDDGVELEVGDDGGGFDPEARAPEGHFGLVMMRERALVAGGTLDVQSAPGRGTRIVARFPREWVEEGEDSADDRPEPTPPPVGTTTGSVDLPPNAKPDYPVSRAPNATVPSDRP